MEKAVRFEPTSAEFIVGLKHLDVPRFIKMSQKLNARKQNGHRERDREREASEMFRRKF